MKSPRHLMQAERNGTERLARGEHEGLGNFDAWAREIIVSRDARCGFEDGAAACRRGDRRELDLKG